MVDKVQSCETNLKDVNAKHNLLMDEYQRMQNELSLLYVEQEVCMLQKNMLTQKHVLLNAEAEAAQGTAVLIDAKNAFSRLSFDVSFGSKQHAIPNSFNIGYIYIPKGYRARIIKANGAFSDYSQKTTGYPVVDKGLAENVTSMRFISDEEDT
jgi:hypothetical protein